MDIFDGLPEEKVKLKTLYWSLRLLECFDAEHPVRGISELSRMTGIIKSSVYNAMATFEYCGYVHKYRDTDKYCLTPKMLQFYNAYVNASQPMIRTMQTMTELSEELGEAVCFGEVFGKAELSILNVEYPRSFPHANMVGMRMPLHCTAMGKAILAAMEPEQLERALTYPLKQFTDRTITDRNRMERELALIRERGYACDDMEYEYGVRGVAVTITPRISRFPPRYAIGIRAPSLRLDDETCARYAGILRSTTEPLSRYAFA